MTERESMLTWEIEIKAKQECMLRTWNRNTCAYHDTTREELDTALASLGLKAITIGLDDNILAPQLLELHQTRKNLADSNAEILRLNGILWHERAAIAQQDKYSRELEERVQAKRRKLQIETLRWASTQAAGALNDDAAAILHRIADRISAGTLVIPESA